MKNKIIKQLTIVSILASTSFANDIAINSVGFNIGVSNTNYKQTTTTDSIIAIDKPSKSFNSYELYTTLNGVYKREDLKPYLSYTYSSNNDLKNQYILTGLNKYYNHDDISLYAGVLVGYGELKWRSNPLVTTQNNDYSSTSFILGLQGGVEYPLNDKFALNINAKYLKHKYETNLQPATTVSSTIEHKSTASIFVGLSYKF